MDKNIIDGRNWEFPEGDDFVDSHLIEKEITENGVYNGPDEGDDIRGYSKATVNVQSGPSIPIISQADWDAMTYEEKKAYGLIIIQSSDSGYVRGSYVNGADYRIIDEIQVYGIDSGTYEVDVIDGSTVEYTFTNCGNQGGVILEVLGSMFTHVKIDFKLSDATNTVQYGTCSKDAILPAVITYGAGRISYTSGATYTVNNFNPASTNLFMGLYNPGGSYKMRVTVTENS